VATHEIVDFHKGLAERDVVARYPRLFATEPLAEEGKRAHHALAAFRAKIAPYLGEFLEARFSQAF
jgi:hypothetical protein